MSLQKRTLKAAQDNPHLRPYLLPLLTRSKQALAFFEDPYPDPEQVQPLQETSVEMLKVFKALNQRFKKAIKEHDISSAEAMVKQIGRILDEVEKQTVKLTKQILPAAKEALATAHKRRFTSKKAMDLRGVIRLIYPPVAWALRYLKGPAQPTLYDEMEGMLEVSEKLVGGLNKGLKEYAKVIKLVKGSFFKANTPEEKKALVRLNQLAQQLILIRDLLKTLAPLLERAQYRFEWGTALPSTITRSQKMEKAIDVLQKEREEIKQDVRKELKKELTTGFSKGVVKSLMSGVGLG